MRGNTAEVETIQLYTLEEARKIINVEQQEKEERRNINRRFFIKQRLSGLCLMVLGFIPGILIGNYAMAVFFLPTGLYFFLSKKKWLDFKEKFM